MTKFRALAATTALLCLASFGVTTASADNGEVNVYTYRETKLIQPLFDAFTADTGIKVNVVSASSGLEQRMKAEGANSPADVLLTVDIGRMDDAVKAERVAADQVGSDRQDRAGAISRSRRSLGRHFDARPRDLCLEGSRQAGRHHLRGTRRSQVEGQDLHPLRPAHLQQRAVRGLCRQARRSQGRGMAARRESQSGAEALRRRPRGRARRRRRQMRYRHRQHLLLGADDEQRIPTRSRGRKRPRSSCRPSKAAAPTSICPACCWPKTRRTRPTASS